MKDHRHITFTNRIEREELQHNGGDQLESHPSREHKEQQETKMYEHEQHINYIQIDEVKSLSSRYVVTRGLLSPLCL